MRALRLSWARCSAKLVAVLPKLSTRTGDADAQLDFATRSDVLAELEAAAAPFTQPDDSLIIPARTWVATATA